MPNQSHVSISNVRSDIALLTLEAGDDGRVNLGDTLLEEIDRAMESLASQSNLAGVIVRSSGRLSFAQAWDVDKLQERFDWDDQQVVRYSQRGRAVLARLSRCPFPTVALIENDCLGSALELTLWADYRLAVDGALVGLPQVTIGLTPGWGGTSLLPRIVGLEAATDLITSGRSIDTQQSLDVELIDEVCDAEAILERALALIDRVGVSKAFVKKRKMLTGPAPGITPETWQEIAEPIAKEFGQRIVGSEDVYPFAPTVALEHLTRTCASPIKVAWQSESTALAQVWGSPTHRGLSLIHI